jgi:alkanesulfonate monooxygenase SsuD/methylene tetrahydromethanopterin reductase-like flavin-dependent oxidoreductase (luciferase family)
MGLLSLGDLITDPVTGRRRSLAERHRNLVDQAVWAEECGFDSFHLGEHHFSEYVLSSPQVVLGAIAERTTSLRLSTGVTLAANLDPVRVAEDYATIDALSNGRVEPCFGRGTLFPDVYTEFGQEERHAKERFAENVELILRLWSDENVDWTGRFRADLHGVTVQPRPTQSPRPPVWIGAGMSLDSVDLAARLGCRLLLPTVFGSWEIFVPAVEHYVERWEHYGHDPAERRIGAISHAGIAVDSSSARERFECRYLRYLERVGDWQTESAERAGRTPLPRIFSDFETMTSTIAMCGSPAAIVERMARAKETLHLDTQLVMIDMGGMPDDDIRASLELFGEHVLPAVAAWT